jgi:hypothetical protein
VNSQRNSFRPRQGAVGYRSGVHRSATPGGGSSAPRTRDWYVGQIHLPLVAVLVVITVGVGIWGWALHPSSSGFQATPQKLTILVSGSGFTVTETLTQNGDSGATLELSQLSLRDPAAYHPLKNGAFVESIEGPTGAGAAIEGNKPVAMLNGRNIPNSSWTFLVLDPGSARPCGDASHKAGVISVLERTAARGFVVQPSPTPASTGNSRFPPSLCLHWTSGGPVNAAGPYLSARFPPLQGLWPERAFTQVPVSGDVGDASVARVLNLDGGNIANFSIQSDPHPVPFGSGTWTWRTTHSPQVIELAAIDETETQRESNNAFYSGVLIGIAGGALIGLITELVVPLSRKRVSS